MRKLKNLAALGKKSNKQKDSGSTHSKRGGPSYEQISARHMSEEFDAPTAKLYHQPNSARNQNSNMQPPSDQSQPTSNFLDFQENYFESRLGRESGSKIYQKRKQAPSDLSMPNAGLPRYASAAVGLGDRADEDLPMVEQVEGDQYNYAARLSKQSYFEAQNESIFEKLDKYGDINKDNKRSQVQEDSKRQESISKFFNDVNSMRDNEAKEEGAGVSRQRVVKKEQEVDAPGGYADTLAQRQSVRKPSQNQSIRKDPEAEDEEEEQDLVFDLSESYKDKEQQEKQELDKESVIGGSGLKFSLADKRRRKRTTQDEVNLMKMGIKAPPSNGADVGQEDAEGDEQEDVREEEADEVKEMAGNDFFSRDRRFGLRNKASVTKQSDFTSKDSESKAQTTSESSKSKDQQIGKAFDFSKNRARGLSFIQEQRKRRKQTITSMQEDNSQGSRKNHDPRATLYNEKAQSHIDKSLQIQDQNNELLRQEMMKELKKYQEIVLGSPDNQAGDSQKPPSLGSKTKSEIIKRENSNILGDNYAGESNQSEIQQQQLLEDFYKQMDIDAETEFNRHLEKKQGLETAASQQQQTTDNELINGHIKISEQDKANKRRHDTFYEHFKDDFTQESIDMIRFIDWNERRHIVEAQLFLNQNSQITRQSLHTDAIQQHMLTPGLLMKDISHKLAIDRQVNACRPTSIAITDELILVGNSAGELSMFDRETQEPYTIYQEKSKEFQGNAITAIDVHPTRPEYVAIGYSIGQIVLLDLTSPDKALKILKDHHPKTPVANVCFCDWNKSAQNQDKQGKQQYFQHGQLSSNFLQLQSNSGNAGSYDETGVPENSPYVQSSKQNQQMDLQAWMIASIDYYGRVVVSAISKNMFMFKTHKQILIEPQQNEAPYTSLSARFKSELHPSHNMNDCVTLLAVGNADRVVIFALSQKEFQPIKEIIKPVYLNIQIGQHRELKNCKPSICWGYGHSPVCKDKCYSTMVVGWGPLIQLYVLNDIMDASACFFEDGHHVMIPDEERSSAPNAKNSTIGQYTTKNADMSPFELEKLFVEKICYLSESVLLVMTRQLEFKLFYTQNLAHSCYSEEKSTKAALYDPEHYKKQRFCQIDQDMFANGLAESRFGQIYNQTLCVYNGMIVGLSVHGVLQFNHLRWDDSLQEYKKIVRGNWIQLFQRAIDIYIGRVKGFKDVPEEQFMRQETMKAELKLLIRNIITQQMEMWAVERQMVQHQAQSMKPAQLPSQPGVPNDDEDENPYAQSSGAANQPPAVKTQKRNPSQQEAFTDLDDEQLLTDLNSLSQQEKSKEMAERYRTLLRIAIEFCVTIQDCYFLFYDLFLMFQEESLESIFLDELKPFIMAGRFYDWDLPGDILQNHIVKYYIMCERPEIVEKLIINLNFIDCPKSFLLELAEYCEQKCLCTGLLYLQTAVSQTKAESYCVPVITTLLQLYRNAKRTNPGTLDEIKCIKDLSSDSSERIRAEKSQIYLGYKILWAIRLFLNGKYFPLGNIPEKQWKKYVLELVDCISQSQIMLDLLYIDSEAYFQIVSIIFYKGKVFDFIKQGSKKKQQAPGRPSHQIISDEVFNELMGGNLTQKQILERFDAVCQSKEEDGYVVPDEIRLQYLFFVANVPSANNEAIQKEPIYYYQCIMQLLRQSQKFLRFNKNLIKRALTRKGRMQSMDKAFNLKQIDEQRYIIAGENALIALLKHCEPLSGDQINQLLIMTEYSKFSHLRVKLLEMKGDYVKCLQLFVEGMRVRNYVANKDSANRVFQFIRERLNYFEQEARGDSNNDASLETSGDLATSSSTVGSSQNTSKPRSQHEEQFRTQIIDCYASLVKIDQRQSYQLVDRYFKEDQERIFEALNGHAEEQYIYLDTMFGEQNDQIQSLIEKHLMSALENRADSERAEQLMKLQKLHFKLLCQVNPTGVIDRVRKIKRNEIKLAPVDCLDICEQYNQIEACAMLSNRISSYLASVTYYMQLVTQKEYFDYPLLIKQLGDLAKSGQPIPIFIPYFEKQHTRQQKLIMKAAAIAANKGKHIGSVSDGFEEQLHGLDLSTSQLIRFDYVIRKAMKICVIESKENHNFDNIDKTWFFVLESMFKIRQYQTQIVKMLQESRSDDQKKAALGSDNKPINYSQCFDEFFQTRLDFVIEQSLNHIELKVFLDRVVGHDKDLKFSDLRQMITNIFTEVRSEAQVLVNAQQTARLQITSTFENCGQNKTNGILFRYRQCNKCNRFLDEEIRDKKKKMELLQYARKGSFISPSIIGAYQFDNDSEDDIFESADQMGFYAGDKMKLFPCGHAFHIQCIVKHAKERAASKLQQQNSGPQGSRNAAKGQGTLLQIAKKIYDDQKCPWCYSDKFQVEFEPTLKKQSERNRTGNFANRYNKQFGLGGEKQATTEDSSDLFSFSEDEGSGNPDSGFQRPNRLMQRNNISQSIVKRHKKDQTEQRLEQFDLALIHEGVTLF